MCYCEPQKWQTLVIFYLDLWPWEQSCCRILDKKFACNLKTIGQTQIYVFTALSCWFVRANDCSSHSSHITSLEESLLQSFFVWKLSGIHWPNYPCENDWWGRPLLLYMKYFVSNWPGWSEIADLRSIFARSASTVTPDEKRSINTNTKSTTRFPMSPRWTS